MLRKKHTKPTQKHLLVDSNYLHYPMSLLHYKKNLHIRHFILHLLELSILFFGQILNPNVTIRESLHLGCSSINLYHIDIYNLTNHLYSSNYIDLHTWNMKNKPLLMKLQSS